MGAAPLVVNVHYQGDYIASKLKELQFDVQVIVESDIRGTAGGIWGARKLLKNASTLVVNGDIYGPLPVLELLRAPPAELVLALAPRESGEGTVGVGARGEVVRLRGERFGTELRSGDYIGVCCLASSCAQTMPEVGCLVADWVLPRLRAGGIIATRMTDVPWIDVGTLESYLRANLSWLKHSGLPHYLGVGAQVGASVELRDSLVGAGARIVGAGVIERTVVLPGAVANAPLSNSIVLPSGRVVAVP